MRLIPCKPGFLMMPVPVLFQFIQLIHSRGTSALLESLLAFRTVRVGKTFLVVICVICNVVIMVLGFCQPCRTRESVGTKSFEATWSVDGGGRRRPETGRQVERLERPFILQLLEFRNLNTTAASYLYKYCEILPKKN